MALYKAMVETAFPSVVDFRLAADTLRMALAEDAGEIETDPAKLRLSQDFRAMLLTKPEEKEVMGTLRMLLAGELFPATSYTDKGGNGRIWDDREFFEKMLKWGRPWSEAQRALIDKRIEYYQENGYKLRKKTSPADAATAPSLGKDADLNNILF